MKLKLKEEENQIIHLKSKLKNRKKNINFERLSICKENSILHLPNKKNIKNDIYNKIQEKIENKKDKRKNKEINTNKNNSIYATYSNSHKNSKQNHILSSSNNKNKSSKNKAQNYNINKFKNNIINIIDLIHDQNDYYNLGNFNKIDSISFKQENLEKSKSKKSSPSSQNKFGTINNNSNRNNNNNNQVMINVNTNIINSNYPIEKFKLYKKIKDYHRIFEKQINEITRNVIQKSIKRTLSAFRNRRHSSPNFHENQRQNQYSNINKQANKNGNVKKKKGGTPNKNNEINFANKNYSSISNHSNGKKTINNFRKKTPHRITRQRKEISPNLKMEHYLYSTSNSNTKLQSKDNLKYNKKDSNYIRIMKKNSLSNNTSKIASNNVSNFNTNNLIKNHIKIQNLLNNLENTDFKNFKNFKKLNHLNSNLILGNIKSKSGINTINSSMSNHSSLKKFKFISSNLDVQSKYK